VQRKFAMEIVMQLLTTSGRFLDVIHIAVHDHVQQTGTIISFAAIILSLSLSPFGTDHHLPAYIALQSPHTLFRSNTFCTDLLGRYANDVASEYLETVIQPLGKLINELPVDFEVRLRPQQ